MAGNKIGGMKAAAKNKALYGVDYYHRIGADGGKNGTTGGFWHAKYVKYDVEFVREQGKKGGLKGKKG